MEVCKMKTTHLKADIRQIVREPILILFMLLPFLLFFLFKALLIYGVTLVWDFLGINLLNYLPYIIAIAIITVPSILGAAIGFLMIDERDSKIYQLMSILPIGHTGYMRHRLIIVMGLTIAYTFIGCSALGAQCLSIMNISILAIYAGMEGCITALVLFHFAQDKVKGLTLAKGMTLLNIFIFVDLINIHVLHWIAWIIPQYWVIRIIQYPSQIKYFVIGSLVHLLWLIPIFHKKQKNC